MAYCDRKGKKRDRKNRESSLGLDPSDFHDTNMPIRMRKMRRFENDLVRVFSDYNTIVDLEKMFDQTHQNR
jgi:hypothetical protein